MLPLNPISAISVGLWGYIATNLVVHRTTAVVVTVRGIDTAAIEGSVFASIDDVIGGVLGSSPTGAFSRSSERYASEGNDQQWKDQFSHALMIPLFCLG